MLAWESGNMSYQLHLSKQKYDGSCCLHMLSLHKSLLLLRPTQKNKGTKTKEKYTKNILSRTSGRFSKGIPLTFLDFHNHQPQIIGFFDMVPQATAKDLHATEIFHIPQGHDTGVIFGLWNPWAKTNGECKPGMSYTGHGCEPDRLTVSSNFKSGYS